MVSKYNNNYDTDALYYFASDDRPTIEGVCDYLDIDYNTYRRWRQIHPGFDRAIEKGLELRATKHKNKKYNKKFCNKVIKMLSQGKTMTAVCAAIGITHDTFYRWQERYPEFKDAVEFGKLLEQEHFEQLGYEAMLGRIDNFNTRVWIMFMKNRFNYADKTEVSGDPNNPLQQEIKVRFIDDGKGQQ